jgi:hypothetical protein
MEYLGKHVKPIYRQHAIKRMFERKICASDIDNASLNGMRIEDYPIDTPFPSCLWLGYSNARPLHIVFADNMAEEERIIITIYEPDPALWSPDFTKRKKP